MADTDIYLIHPLAPFRFKCLLGLLDYMAPSVYTPYLLIFKQTPSIDKVKDRKNFTERLRISLQMLLQQSSHGVRAIPELLGTLFEDAEDGTLYLKVDEESAIRLLVCSRDDVTFNGLRPDLHFPQSFLPPEIFAKNLRDVVTKNDPKGVPAFWAQVTFIEGGFLIMANFHHAICDGVSKGKIIQRWLQMYRDLAEGNHQCVEDKLLVRALGSRIHISGSEFARSKNHPELRPSPSRIGEWLPCKTIRLDQQLFRVDPSALVRLRREAQLPWSSSVSMHDLICAVTWHSITRARFAHLPKGNGEPAAISRLGIARDIRNVIQPPLPCDSAINAVYPICIDYAIDRLLDTGADACATIAASIRNAIVEVDEEHLQSANNLLSPRLPWRARRPDTLNRLGNDLFITSLSGIFRSTDAVRLPNAHFQAFRTPARNGREGMVALQPTFGSRERAAVDGTYPGGVELYVELEKEHLDNLRSDPEWLKYATWAEYGGYRISEDTY